jgi:hypothetical protein
MRKGPGLSERLRGFAEPRLCANAECRIGAWQRWAGRAAGTWLNGEWFCRAECFELGLARLLRSSVPGPAQSSPSVHRLPLGLWMLSRGLIDEGQLRAALALQGQGSHLKIGSCLVNLGAIRDHDLTRALGAQNGLPVLKTHPAIVDGALPLALMRQSECVALRPPGRFGPLYLGFDGVVDRALLTAVELIVECACEPCVVSSEVVAEQIELCSRKKDPDEIVFESHCSTEEVIRTVRSYGERITGNRVRVAMTRKSLWVRLVGTRNVELLFSV